MDYMNEARAGLHGFEQMGNSQLLSLLLFFFLSLHLCLLVRVRTLVGLTIYGRQHHRSWRGILKRKYEYSEASSFRRTC